MLRISLHLTSTTTPDVYAYPHTHHRKFEPCSLINRGARAFKQEACAGRYRYIFVQDTVMSQGQGFNATQQITPTALALYRAHGLPRLYGS